MGRVSPLRAVFKLCRRRARSDAPYQLPGLGDGHRLVHQDIFHLLPGSARPEDFNGIRLGHIAQADGDGQFGLGKIAAGGHYLPQQGLAADTHLDPGTDGVAVAFGADKFQSDPVVVRILVVAQQQRRAANLREHTSRSPSPSMSAKAAPRPTMGLNKSVPAFSGGTATKHPPL